MTRHPGDTHRKSWRMPVWLLRLPAPRICAPGGGSCPAAGAEGAEAGVAWPAALACPGMGEAPAPAPATARTAS
eukprot:10964513-Heterocapsa_arctica.AAC.1